MLVGWYQVLTNPNFPTRVEILVFRLSAISRNNSCLQFKPEGMNAMFVLAIKKMCTRAIHRAAGVQKNVLAP
jgi:hypothetical protein